VAFPKRSTARDTRYAFRRRFRRPACELCRCRAGLAGRRRIPLVVQRPVAGQPRFGAASRCRGVRRTLRGRVRGRHCRVSKSWSGRDHGRALPARLHGCLWAPSSLRPRGPGGTVARALASSWRGRGAASGNPASVAQHCRRRCVVAAHLAVGKMPMCATIDSSRNRRILLRTALALFWFVSSSWLPAADPLRLCSGRTCW
jgi:hypothetical protein